MRNSIQHSRIVISFVWCFNLFFIYKELWKGASGYHINVVLCRDYCIHCVISVPCVIRVRVRRVRYTFHLSGVTSTLSALNTRSYHER